MAAAVVLDSMILSEAVRPAADPELATWLDALLASGRAVVIPAIVDYEVRRYLLFKRANRQLQRLDAYVNAMLVAELTIEQLRRAAAFWAEAQRSGRPSTSPERLDADVIIAAQTEAVAGPRDVILATENVHQQAKRPPAQSSISKSFLVPGATTITDEFGRGGPWRMSRYLLQTTSSSERWMFKRSSHRQESTGCRFRT